MVDIQSKEVIDKISDELKIQPALQIPRNVGNQIDLSYNVNKVNHVNVHASKNKSSTGTITVLGVSSDRDTFITNLFFNYQADGANTGTEVLVTLDIEGFADEREVISINKVPSVAVSESINMPFTVPLKMKRGGAVKMTHTFGAGTGLIECVVMGYTTDPQ